MLEISESAMDTSTDNESAWTAKESLIINRLRYLFAVLAMQTVLGFAFEFVEPLTEQVTDEIMQILLWGSIAIVFIFLVIACIVLTVKLSRIFNGTLVTVILGILALIHFLNVIPFFVLYIQAKSEFANNGKSIRFNNLFKHNVA